MNVHKPTTQIQYYEDFFFATLTQCGGGDGRVN